jgi:DNA-binding MarR family transcriptional regulator
MAPSKADGTLSLLQLVADRPAIRPSEIADVQGVHPSLVTRQVRELEDAGHVQVAADPAGAMLARVHASFGPGISG